MRIARVFPRRTKSTPVDDLAFIGSPDLFSGNLEIDKIHISVVFTWDIPEAEQLYKEWSQIAPTEIGGVAIGTKGGDFVPGMYLKKGYVITSRGCRNRCWFCSVWKREGDIRELPITEGFNVLDDNLLSCSDSHIKNVFTMLTEQKKKGHRIEFTGGLEALILKQWHAEELKKLNPAQLFFAYDTPSDREPLFEAGKLLFDAGFSKKSHALRAYVLIGYPGDTFEKAEIRLYECIKAGFMPMAMLYRDESGAKNKEWGRLQREWARPAIIYSKMKN
ncbi:MAG: hypothetical protein FWF38_00450 [Spirochaetaceae bacterium]|nr:hypothetical protein [Spirochaetaceae bacterium]